MIPRPHRRWEIKLHIEADGWEEALREIVRLAAHIEEHGPTCDQISGGYDAGSFVHITERPQQTHDAYVTSLNAYLAAAKPP